MRSRKAAPYFSIENGRKLTCNVYTHKMQQGKKINTLYTEKANPRNKMIPMANISKNTDYNAWLFLFFVVIFFLH